MSLTRKLLRELELNDNVVERIIAAHVETVDALRQERDAALARATAIESSVQERDELRALAEARLNEASAARDELSAYRTQVAEERHQASRRSALAQALTAQGANANALPLLLDAISLSEEDWEGDTLRSAEVLQPYRAKYSALFSVKSPVPITKIAPPVNAGGTLSPADVKRMSATDINRNWSAVKTALQNN